MLTPVKSNFQRPVKSFEDVSTMDNALIVDSKIAAYVIVFCLFVCFSFVLLCTVQLPKFMAHHFQ